MTDETKQKPDKANRNYGGGAKEWVVSTIAGVLSGAVAAGAAIRNEFSALAKLLPGIADFKDEASNTKEPGLTSKLEEKLYKVDLEHYQKEGTNWKMHAEQKHALKKQYAKDVVEILEKKYNMSSKGLTGLLKGTYERYWHIGDNTKKNDVIFKGITIATVIGVGTYNLLTSIATRKKAREIEDLILDKVLEEPMAKVEAAHRAMHAEPENKVTHVATHERLQAANAREMTVRA